VLLPLALLLTLGSVTAYAAEPFVDVHSPLLKQATLSGWGNSENAPRQTAAGNLIIPAIHSDVTLTGGRLQGTALYTLEPAGQKRPLAFSLNGGLAVSAVAVDGSPAPYQLEKGRLTFSLPAGASNVEIAYAGHIKSPSLQSLAGYVGGESVYLQEGANWLPQPEGMALGTMLTGSITADENLTFAVPGNLIAREEQAGRRIWHYEMAAPLPDVALYGGVYELLPLKVDGAMVELYVSPRHREAVADSGLAGVVEEIVRFYSETLGAYPFDVPLKVVETALYKSGGHSSLNLVTVAETAFNIQGGESADSFAWYNAVDLLAHEIAHQWFGSGVQVAMQSPWSSEGLASFLATAYIAHAFSPELAASMGKYPWLSAVQEQENSYFADPAALAGLSPAKREQVSGEMMHAALYYEMPLLLLDMQETLGEELFCERLAAVYQEYRGGEYLTWHDFLAAMELGEEEVSLARFYTNSAL
jgi:aminopeptidase N